MKSTPLAKADGLVLGFATGAISVLMSRMHRTCLTQNHTPFWVTLQMKILTITCLLKSRVCTSGSVIHSCDHDVFINSRKKIFFWGGRVAERDGI